MPELLPFAGLRFDPGRAGPLSQLTCPPYDVISAPLRAALAARNPYNGVRVELPEGHYREAADLLARWEGAAVLRREGSEVLYGYRMSSALPDGGVRHTTGVIGALVLEPPGQGILPHEHTTPKAKSDRLELLRATRCNTSPIWCLCAEPGLVAAVGPPPPSAASSLDEEGNEHLLWPITSPVAQAAVARAVAAAPLLVADGHHRYETALAYQAEAPVPGNPDEGPGPGAVMALVVELSEQHLEVRAIHRLVSGLPGAGAVVEAFRAEHDLVAYEGPADELLGTMVTAGSLGLVTASGTYLARPRPGTPSAATPLDSSRADTTLGRLGPASHVLRYEHDVPGALAEVGRGDAQALVLCRPATVAQIAATGRGGERIPPKTTFFWPKPLTGMVLRSW